MTHARICVAAMIVAVAAARVSSAPLAAVDQSEISRTEVTAQSFLRLTEKVRMLEERVARQEDIEAIRKLVFSYGYYMDTACMIRHSA